MQTKESVYFTLSLDFVNILKDVGFHISKKFVKVRNVMKDLAL